MRVAIAALFACLSLCALAAPARADEVMTDRCSREVAFPKHYDGKPNSVGTVILKRGKNGTTPWSEPFTVDLGDDGHVRWWCHSTTGNVFDLGTATFNPGGIAACATAVGGTVISAGSGAASLAGCASLLNFGGSAWKGWTPERSRCSDHSARMRARLGKNRLLQTECLS